MKLSRIMTVFVAIVLLAAFAVTAYSQDDKTVTIAGILKDAKCPLTDKQVKQYSDLDFSQGFQVFRELYEMFSDDQNDALKEALGTQPGRNDRPERPRNMMQVVMFEKADCPLTVSQLKKLKEIPQARGRGVGSEAMMDILTDEQMKVMESLRGGRGGAGGRRSNR